MSDSIESMKRMFEMVDLMWIVPSTDDLSHKDFKDWEDTFTFLDLSQNFRNSRDVVKTIKSFAEEDYDYKEGIVMPPENFPTGCPPVFVYSFEDAIRDAQKRNKDGILVIVDTLRQFKNRHCDKFDMIDEKCKVYHLNRTDFEDWQNPYKFLQEGNVLIVDVIESSGFEWATVIAFEDIRAGGPSLHACNSMMRCTTNLIIVLDSDSESDSGESDISKGYEGDYEMECDS